MISLKQRMFAAAAAVAAVFALCFLPAFGRTAQAADRGAEQALAAANVYLASHGFSTRMSGVIKARVFGVPYTQKVSGGRSVAGGDFCEHAESRSALVKTAFRRQGKDGRYSVAQGRYKRKRFCYAAPVSCGYDGYVAAYGKPATGLTKYETDGAIRSATRTGEGTYVYILDPQKATVYSRNEVRTLVGAQKPPEYASVELTLVMENGRPVRTVTRETFTVDKFGGIKCTSEYVEEFEY